MQQELMVTMDDSVFGDLMQMGRYLRACTYEEDGGPASSLMPHADEHARVEHAELQWAHTHGERGGPSNFLGEMGDQTSSLLAYIREKAGKLTLVREADCLELLMKKLNEEEWEVFRYSRGSFIYLCE
jgi:hypothetical protein